MSNILIVVKPMNGDSNSLARLLAAAIDAGAEVFAVDEQNYVIEAAVRSDLVSTIAAMTGVSYVRSVFTYLCERAEVEIEAEAQAA